jgi:hypothetical protein
MTSTEVVRIVGGSNFRREVPKEHRASLDTRVRWLWNQRFGTIQNIYQSSPDLLDRTAATLFINAIWAKDLNSISMIFRRLEGGPIMDDQIVAQQTLRV